MTVTSADDVTKDRPVVEQIVAECVKFGEVDAQVGHLEQILHLLRVRVVDGQVGRKDTEDDLALGRRRHVRVARLADHLRQVARRLARHAGEGIGAVVCKVAVDLPRPAKVVGPFDEQRRRPERLERHDQVGEVELGLQVQLDADVLHAVLRLPPRATSRHPENMYNSSN